MTIPRGNGEACGPESADGMGTPLPSRPARSRANDAKHASFLGSGCPKDQGGFGKEDMEHSADHMSLESTRPSDVVAVPPDLMVMGDPGEAFGGM